MAGGSQKHCRIILNIAAALDDVLHDGPCRTFASDMKVRVKSLNEEFYYYPDVMVACEDDDSHEYYIEKPSVIFEVLSESTERIDRHEKLLAYRSIPTLMEYAMVSQKKKEVVVVKREHGWKSEVYGESDDTIAFASIQKSLSISRIYRNIVLD
jgi:Uma2 family endonuclease